MLKDNNNDVKVAKDLNDYRKKGRMEEKVVTQTTSVDIMMLTISNA